MKDDEYKFVKKSNLNEEFFLNENHFMHCDSQNEDKVGELKMLKSNYVTKKIQKVGEGASFPSKIDLVKLKYTGYFSDSLIQFDSTNNQEIVISLNDDSYVKGFKIGLENMKKNEIATININSSYGFTMEEEHLKIPDDYQERRKELSEKNLIYNIELIDFIKRIDISENERTFIKTILTSSEKGYIGESDLVKFDILVSLNNQVLIEKKNYVEYLLSPSIPIFIRKAISSMFKGEESRFECKYLYLKNFDCETIRMFKLNDNDVLFIHAKIYSKLSTRSFYKDEKALFCCLKSSRKYNHPTIESSITFSLKILVNNKNVFSNFILKNEIEEEKYDLMQIPSQEDEYITNYGEMTLSLLSNRIPSLIIKAIKHTCEDEISYIKYSKVDKITDCISNDIIQPNWFYENSEVKIFIYLRKIINLPSLKKALISDKIQRINQMKDSAAELYNNKFYTKALKLYNKIIYLFTNGDLKPQNDEIILNNNFYLEKIRQSCLSNIILCKFKMEKYNEVIEEADIAFESNPKNLKALFFKAKSLAYLKEFSRALECIQEARKIDPYSQDIIKEEAIIELDYHNFKEKEKQLYSKMFK